MTRVRISGKDCVKMLTMNYNSNFESFMDEKDVAALKNLNLHYEVNRFLSEDQYKKLEYIFYSNIQNVEGYRLTY